MDGGSDPRTSIMITRKQMEDKLVQFYLEASMWSHLITFLQGYKVTPISKESHLNLVHICIHVNQMFGAGFWFD